MTTPQPVFVPNLPPSQIPLPPFSPTLLTGNVSKNGSKAEVKTPDGIDHMFDIVGECQFNRNAEITDHYCEDNTFIHDHIAIRPFTIQLKGYKGEVVDRRSNQFPPVFTKYVQKLNTIEQLLPEMLPGAYYVQQTLAKTLYFGNLINSSIINSKNYLNVAKSLWSGPNIFENEQTRAFDYFSGLMNAKTMVEVNTPWGRYKNLIIETIAARQGEESSYISDFMLTLKQVRFLPSALQTVPFDIKNFQERGGFQRQSDTNKGNAQGKTVPEQEKSILFQLNQFANNKEPGLISG